MRYAVVDLETTGVFPRRDRIVEVGIVTLADDCTVVDEYTTLVNPQRDVGPTSIHGIEAGHVRDAPTFLEIAGDVAARLQHRILVGHNVRFDQDFLREEFGRAGVAMGSTVHLCTLRMAYALEPDESSRKLRDCCRRAGLVGDGWHGALQDARATARLFGIYVTRAEREQCEEVCRDLGLAVQYPLAPWPDVPEPTGRCLCRQEATARAMARRHYLGRLIDALPGDDAPTAVEAEYLELLDRALADRLIEPTECDELLAEAGRRGLRPSHVHACHHLYMRTLVRRAVDDGIVTPAERSDIYLVASMLGVSKDVIELMLQEASRAGTARGSLVGKVVCFTGEFTMPREEATRRAEAQGIVVMDSVNKKTHLLVAADPESISGKAEKARRYGIPIISEQEFWSRVAESSLN